MSGETDPPVDGDDPIDAQFEPVPPAPDYVATSKAKRAGPGWIALIVTGLLAAIGGGVIGAGVSGGGGDDYTSAAEMRESIQAANRSSLGQYELLAETISDLSDRMTRELAAVSAAQGDAPALGALYAEVEDLGRQLEALDVTEQEVGEAEILNIGQIMERLDALERADENEVTSPRLANRAITALRSRVEEIEEASEERREATQNLYERFAELEIALGETGGDAVSEDVIAELREDVDALKAQSDAAARRGEEVARLSHETQELRDKDAAAKDLLDETRGVTSALSAVLAIQAAALDGRPFQSAFAELDAALPGNRSVAKLKASSVRGAPTVAMLQADFELAEADARTAGLADQPTDNGNDGWGWVRNVFGDAVQVRRKGAVDDEFIGVMSEAKAALASRDIEKAAGLVESLEGPRREAFADWLGEARRRQGLENGLDELRLAIMRTGQ